MKKKFFLTVLVFMVSITLLTGTALAHTIFFACWDNGDGTLSCEGGYTDGSTAEGALVNVTDAKGALLFSGKLNSAGELKFNRPPGEFTVTLEGSLGHTVVIKSKDIK